MIIGRIEFGDRRIEIIERQIPAAEVDDIGWSVDALLAAVGIRPAVLDEPKPEFDLDILRRRNLAAALARRTV